MNEEHNSDLDTNETASETVTISLINEAIVELDAEISLLHKSVSNLYERLKPVMTTIPKISSPDGKEYKNGLSPMVLVLRKQKDRVTAANYFIEDILGRLEL
jgi:uncharacterized coiled-coil protein SlyX